MVIIYLLLGYLITDTSVLCTHGFSCPENDQGCDKENVTIISSSSSPHEGDNVNLTCQVNSGNLSVAFQWKKGEMEQPGKNTSVLVIIGVSVEDGGDYVCSVKSLTFCCESAPYTGFCCESAPYTLTVSNNNVIILVICGISALVLVLIMGLIMKCKLKRDNEKHKERMRQRVQAGQAGGPFPFTPRET